MAKMMPLKIVKNLSFISEDILKQFNIKAIILDVDNTLTTHDNPEPEKWALEWTARMKKKGYKLIIISNNYKKRVEPFAKSMGLDFISMGCKPLPFSYWRAKFKLKCKLSEFLVVGDQLYTDVLGGYLSGMKSIIVEPISDAELKSIQKRRAKEKRYLEKNKHHLK